MVDLMSRDPNNTADIRLDAMLENCIFYIFPKYEFSHSLGLLATKKPRDMGY